MVIASNPPSSDEGNQRLSFHAAARWLAVEPDDLRRMLAQSMVPFARFWRPDTEGQVLIRGLWLWVMVAEGSLTFDAASEWLDNDTWEPDASARVALDRWRRRQLREALPYGESAELSELDDAWLRREATKAIDNCCRWRPDLRGYFRRNWTENNPVNTGEIDRSDYSAAVEVFELACREAVHNVRAGKVHLPFQQHYGRNKGKYLRTLPDYARHIGYLAVVAHAERLRNEYLAFGQTASLDATVHENEIGDVTTLAEVLQPGDAERALLLASFGEYPPDDHIVNPDDGRLWEVYMDLLEEMPEPAGRVVELAVLREWPYALAAKRLISEFGKAEVSTALTGGLLTRGNVCDAVIRFATLARARPSKWGVLREELSRRLRQWRHDAALRKAWRGTG